MEWQIKGTCKNNSLLPDAVSSSVQCRAVFLMDISYLILYVIMFLFWFISFYVWCPSPFSPEKMVKTPETGPQNILYSDIVEWPMQTDSLKSRDAVKSFCKGAKQDCISSCYSIMQRTVLFTPQYGVCLDCYIRLAVDDNDNVVLLQEQHHLNIIWKPWI